MRVIAGFAKGHTLKSLKGQKTRPTLERVREAIYSVLGDRIIDAAFLDLFAGTGAMGIEALSRGASHCIFNDNTRECVQLIETNLAHCHLSKQSKIFCLDSLKLLELMNRKDAGDDWIDIVYVDPPYELEIYEKVLLTLGQATFLRQGSLVIAETSNKKELPAKAGRLELVKKTSYSDTVVWYYKI